MIVYDIQKLTKIYRGQSEAANREISLQIKQGEIFGMLGDNGAGKSTLVRQMADLLPPSSGQILLYGQPLAKIEVSLYVGYMPQEGQALNNMTVGEALYFTAHLRGMSRREARTERDRLLALWQIGDLRHKYSTRLSGGQRRLLRLAVAMAGSPPVLLLDEPTNDLDPQRRKLVWDVLRQLNRERGTTIIFITHDALEAEKVVQRVGIMKAGQLVALGRPADLKRQLGEKLRLALFFAPGQPPTLPPNLVYSEVQAGQWLLPLDWTQATAVLAKLNPAQIDDFRLYSATLEDLYLHYANRS